VYGEKDDSARNLGNPQEKEWRFFLMGSDLSYGCHKEKYKRQN
jgi:hypothetical protein